MINEFLNRNLRIKKSLKKILGIDRLDSRVSYLEEKIIYGYIQSLDARLKKIEDLPKSIALSSCSTPTLTAPISQACTNAQFLEPDYLRWCSSIKAERRFHRKQWEYIYILRCLELSGVIRQKSKGIGFGVGHEPIAPYLATQGVHCLATDLDLESAQKKGWVDTNQYTRRLEDLAVFGIASESQLKSHIKMLNVDMNAIPTELQDESYDFTWSACAFEHLGSINQGLEFVMNSLRCLKPGGIAVHTTELNVSSNNDTLNSGPTVLFRMKDFEYLANKLRDQGHHIELNFNLGDSRLDDFYDIPPFSDFNHIKLKIDNFVTTSYGLLIKKNESNN